MLYICNVIQPDYEIVLKNFKKYFHKRGYTHELKLNKYNLFIKNDLAFVLFYENYRVNLLSIDIYMNCFIKKSSHVSNYKSIIIKNIRQEILHAEERAITGY